MKKDVTEYAPLYTDDWYSNQVESSLQSARRYVAHLSSLMKPAAVLDVGCGRGAWLKAWKERGASRLVGLDGHWNSQAKMIDPAIEFRQADLNAPFAVEPRVDLAISLEVAEHLREASSAQFVKCLTDAADVVVFGAALPHQGGTDHVNEQRHSFWARLFADRGYSAFDAFRPVFWNDSAVCWWYRQNTFLYVSQGCELHLRLREGLGLAPLVDYTMMDCVHPVLLERRSRELNDTLHSTFTQHLSALPESFIRAVKGRLSRRTH